MQDFEKLGVFYMGKQYSPETRETTEELLLYDAKDLTTHAVCVGMTGSGKTGLCISLLEEALIDGIPAIVIDPKGDIGNLMLTFPDLLAEDFRPWIDEGAAVRAGMTPDEYAIETAKRWRTGLEAWGQDGDRIERLNRSGEVALYTPGSTAGLPVSVLRSFSAPTPAVRDDADAYRDRIEAAVSGLLALMGVTADPLQSREHILISQILNHAWQQGNDVSLADMIRFVQAPPFSRVGVFDLESFFPSKDRTALSLRLNNLLASPSFSTWMAGKPLDIQELLYDSHGKPRVSIMSIAHLSDSERMFFVTILLNEVLSWVRNQPGTSSLRAILYMDEVFGFFPPTANPPSKKPMLTLMKQARAFGLGVVLATQNPVDLDYKSLSNAGTWFIGRLQTERDVARVIDGLEGAAASAGQSVDRGTWERRLAGLGSRVFLLKNVHEDEPVLFETRWVMSYLRGPLTRNQIQKLTDERFPERRSQPAAFDPLSTESATNDSAASASPPADIEAARPVLPTDAVEKFVPVDPTRPETGRRVYQPAVVAAARLHFVRSTFDIDVWESRRVIARLDEDQSGNPWRTMFDIPSGTLDLMEEPEDGLEFAGLPAAILRMRAFSSVGRKLKDELYRQERLTVYECKALKERSRPGETEADFRIRLRQHARECRDLEIEKLRSSFAAKEQTLEKRLRSAEAKLAKEKAQAQRATMDSAISIGSSILGALFGRKLRSATNVGRAATGARSIGRAADQRGDIEPAEENVNAIQQELKELEAECEAQLAEVEAGYDPDTLELKETPVSPRKSDIEIEGLFLVWLPYEQATSGAIIPTCDLSGLPDEFSRSPV